MRELYKAKRTDGEWVEGYLLKSLTGICYIVKCFDHILNVIEKYEVDEKTICQCTGMTVDTKMVWENDIVVDAKGNYYQAFWYDKYYQFAFKCIKAKNADSLLQDATWELWSLARTKELEVVGSAFDHLELTK
ncbi:MAG: hypothetical protein PUC12_01330 [Clostridiales bacterium]|nr:hypothetical protein [Clostridiales bacterium]